MSTDSPEKLFEDGDIPTRTVDLVMYLDTERVVIGKAEVNPDGTMTTTIDPIANPMITNIIGAIDMGEFSFSLPRVFKPRLTSDFTAGDLPFDGVVPE